MLRILKKAALIMLLIRSFIVKLESMIIPKFFHMRTRNNCTGTNIKIRN